MSGFSEHHLFQLCL